MQDMTDDTISKPREWDEEEIQEWIEAFDSVVRDSGPEALNQIITRLRTHASVSGVQLPFSARTPYINTIPVHMQPVFPGDQEMERRIKSLVRWNALAMVVRANRVEHGIFPRTRPRRRCLRLASTIFSARVLSRLRETASIFKATRRPAFMRAHSWKDDSQLLSLKISGAN
jgi:hypothetical protein